MEYYPYGEVWWGPKYDRDGAGVKKQQFLFTSKELDEETGLYYFGARYYDPRKVRWESVDPLLALPVGRLDQTSAQSSDPKAAVSDDPARLSGTLNRYGYALHEPRTYIDPDGRDTFRQNRDIGDNEITSNSDPLSHTLVFTTKPDGTLNHTYSWGNAANTHGWNKDQPEDRKAAVNALERAGAAEHGGILDKLSLIKHWLFKVGDSTLDPFVDEAFNSLNQKRNRFHG